MAGIGRMVAMGVAAALMMGGACMRADVAHADPGDPSPAQGHSWCPGQALPFPEIRWDMNVCHTWYYMRPGTGNVRMVDWRGNPGESFISADIPAPMLTPPPPPPPLPPGTPFCSPRGALIIIPPICDEIGVDPTAR